jgi:lysozyme family protein
MFYPDIFERCIKVILKNEGGYSNNSADPGGETNMGIAKKFYPNEDIKNMTKERAMEIYYKDYWSPMHLEKLKDDNLVLQVFDFGVNAGIRTSIKLLQTIVGVEDDGILGPISAYFINNHKGSLLEEFKSARILFYNNLAEIKPSLKVFLKGWLNRVKKTKF